MHQGRYSMRIGLLADIHGNALALEAVLSSARRNGVDRLLISGDFVGYYFDPLKVLEILSTWQYDAVRGNHEEMLDICQREPKLLSEVRSKYGPGIEIAIKQLQPNQINYLCNLPHPLDILIDNVNFRLCHGSPDDINRYIYPDLDVSIIENLDTANADIIVFGHTHYPMLKYIGTKLFVNPGSVGQPRNRQPDAHWAVYDTRTKQVEFKTEEYDHKTLAKYCRLTYPDIPYLAEVLERLK